MSCSLLKLCTLYKSTTLRIYFIVTLSELSCSQEGKQAPFEGHKVPNTYNKVAIGIYSCGIKTQKHF